ncbi:unnamed protein product, partial [Amoebophrya sp. A25]|eukprot:GSA25T00020848001.1
MVAGRMLSHGQRMLQAANASCTATTGRCLRTEYKITFQAESLDQPPLGKK